MNKTLAVWIAELEAQVNSTCLGRQGVDPDFWPLLQQACPRCSGGGERCIVDMLKVAADTDTLAD